MNLNISHDIVKAALVSDTNLPNQVFKIKFDQYLFFDASLRATDGIVVAIKNILKQLDVSPISAAIFTSISNELLVSLNESDDWEETRKELDIKLFDSFVAESFFIISPKEDWAAFQYYPVDVGVIGFRSNKLPLALENDAVDFFSCNDILDWYKSGKDKDADKIKYYGKEFLDMLLNNYKSNI